MGVSLTGPGMEGGGIATTGLSLMSDGVCIAAVRGPPGPTVPGPRLNREQENEHRAKLPKKEGSWLPGGHRRARPGGSGDRKARPWGVSVSLQPGQPHS